MRTIEQDEIVESRVWRGRVEIVSRVNWTHIARIRRTLGLTAELGCLGNTRRFTLGKPAKIAARRNWRRARTRAA
jgi:hypothetical protein